MENNLERMKCQNCRYFNLQKKFCAEKNQNVKINDSCANFDETQINFDVQELLKNPVLFDLITEHEFDKKIVGEIEARKVIFLCACGRLVENCQIASYNLLVNDEAGIGKDYVVEAVLNILPKQSYIHKTRISPAVFTYWHNSKYEPDWTWDGKVFYPEDISQNVLNSDVFKVMSSKGSSATIVIKQKAIDIKIIGKPVMITTTASTIPNPELTRRYAILGLDSSENQTKKIMERHSEFRKQGIIPEYDEIYTIALSKLKRVKIKIPFADLIYTHFPTKNIMMRTNYPRFLDLISASTSFHQFQRKTDSAGYYLAEGQDYDIARECFLKLCSNKYMVNLTINQKKILEKFESWERGVKGSVTQLHPKMSFLSIPALQTNLGILTKYGILQTSTEKDSWNRDLTMYSLAENYNIDSQQINIPTYAELLKYLKQPVYLKQVKHLKHLSEKQAGIKDTKGVKGKNGKNQLDKTTKTEEKPDVEYEKVEHDKPKKQRNWSKF